MKDLILALDQGTTSSRAVVLNRQGKIEAVKSRAFRQIYPKAGWVEHDPMEIWESQIGAAQALLKENAGMAERIAAVGITNQRETVVVWNRHTGKPITNAIVWQCRRTADVCEHIKQEPGLAEQIKLKTGLMVDPYFSASKIMWILEHVEGALQSAQKGDLLVGTIDAWLIWNLTNGRVHATDYTNASRTMLYNIKELCWDDFLLSRFGIPKAMLPKVVSSSGVLGACDSRWFGLEIPIAGAAGDQHAALFGQACFHEGMAKNTYGTGCFLLMNTGKQKIISENRLLSTIAWGIDGEIDYALEGSVFIAGAAIQWLRDELQIISTSEETEAMALQVEDTNGVVFVPAFVGLGAPYWDAYARGTITGLTRGANRHHLVRAALESIAYQTRDVLEAMEKDSHIQLQQLRIDGGASANNFLAQFQADQLGVSVLRPAQIETTAVGAAFLAGLAAGIWKDKEEIGAMWEAEHQFLPQGNAQRKDDLYAAWRQAVEKSKSSEKQIK